MVSTHLKNIGQIGSSPPSTGENKTYLKPPPSKNSVIFPFVPSHFPCGNFWAPGKKIPNLIPLGLAGGTAPSRVDIKSLPPEGLVPFQWERSFFVNPQLHPWKINGWNLKNYLPNRKVLFQPPFFRGYVKFRGCNMESSCPECFFCFSRFADGFLLKNQHSDETDQYFLSTLLSIF